MKVIGLLLVGIPFLGFFWMTAKSLGFKAAFILWIFSICTTACIVVGVHMILSN